MRSSIRTVIVVAVRLRLSLCFSATSTCAGGDAISFARGCDGSLVSLVDGVLNMVIRALRWQYLLEPLGHASFANAFRATAVGFAASSILPARAGEVIRPYFLARHENMSATGAFATIILERVLDVLTVLVLLASYVFVFDRGVGARQPDGVRGGEVGGGATALGAIAGAARRDVRARRRSRPHRTMDDAARSSAAVEARRAHRRASPKNSRAGSAPCAARDGCSSRCCGRFRCGCRSPRACGRSRSRFASTCRSPDRFFSIALLVIGVAVPTPGAIGGFHEAYPLGATMFFGAPDDAAVGAAIVAARCSPSGPSLLLGLFFAAQAGLNLSGMRSWRRPSRTERSR